VRERSLGTRLARVVLIVIVVGALALPPLSASGQLPGPLNDLLALGEGGGQRPATAQVQRNAEPPFVPTPQVRCGPGSRPEPGIQGRVPEGSADRGLWCNVDLIGHQGRSGGFKVYRYTDPKGHDCAFYDTALLFPINAVKLSGDSLGVAVLDMSNPRRPRQTATLTEPPMMSPHESLIVNPRRGLLAAVLGNPSAYPGMVSIYDVRTDCRRPRLLSSSVVARLGHESGFSADGKTFYATSTAFNNITAVDVTNPRSPRPVWQGAINSHGMSLTGDGKRAYLADTDGELVILDTSEIQARKENPQAREISRLTWHAASIPQNAIPFRRDGRPYVLEIDEYTQGTAGGGDGHLVGAARIIDIRDERRPRVISNLRLRVNQPKEHEEASGDPGQLNPTQGYAAHYCDVPTRVDPLVVACSFISSGLRVFDISDIRRPREIGYFVAPTRRITENGFDGSNFAMSKPAFVPSRREIWYSDGTSGFYVLRVKRSVWPTGAGRRGCLARRAPIGPRNIGRVRLGLSRRALLRRVPAPRRRTRRRWTWCVKGGRGRVSAAFNRRGRVALVATTAPRHGNRRIHPGTRRRTLRRAYPRLRRVRGNLFRANRRSPRLFGLRRGRVRYIAVTSRRTIARRRTLRAYLRYAGF
jgi:LVIVD repeat